ncbi:MAG: type II toxin-antitoxin system RelE/ParE family toxin, partial [Pyrinomonadaceae bacterium]
LFNPTRGWLNVTRLSVDDNIKKMLESFGNRLAEDLFYDRLSKEARQFPPEFRRAARRKLLYLHDAGELKDLRVPPGNRLEALKGKLTDHHSIRINSQWRIIFRWEAGNAKDVQVVDYH